MALGLAEAGADIVGLDRCESDETGAAVTKLGRRFMQVCCDLREASVADLNAIVAQIVAEMGRLDILVNNAGIIRRAPALEFSEADWDDVLQINLKSVFFLSQAAGARLMVRAGRRQDHQRGLDAVVPGRHPGAVVHRGQERGGGHHPGLANEWAKYGINVNAIAPGYMATDNTAPIRADQARRQAILDRIPAGRRGTG